MELLGWIAAIQFALIIWIVQTLFLMRKRQRQIWMSCYLLNIKKTAEIGGKKTKIELNEADWKAWDA